MLFIGRKSNRVEAPYGGSVRVDMTEAGVTPEFEQKREAAEQKVAAILGPERYREYQLAQDPGFQTLAEIGERFGIAREKLIRAHEARQQAGPFNMDPLMARRYGLQPNPQAQNAQAALKELLGDAALTALQRGPNLQQIERSLPP